MNNIFDWKPDLDLPKQTSGIEHQGRLHHYKFRMMEQRYFPLLCMSIPNYKPRVSPLKELGWDACLVIAAQFSCYFGIEQPIMFYDGNNGNVGASYNWKTKRLIMHHLTLINIIHELVHHLSSYRNRIKTFEDSVTHRTSFMVTAIEVMPWLPKLKEIIDVYENELLMVFLNTFLYDIFGNPSDNKLKSGIKKKSWLNKL